MTGKSKNDILMDSQAPVYYLFVSITQTNI